MYVARNGEGVVSLVLFEEIKESFLFVRDIAPILHSFLEGDHLDATGDDAEIGRDLKLFVEPLPLGFSKEGFAGVFGGFIPTDGAGFFFLFGLWEFVAEVTGVEDDDLADLARCSKCVGSVNTFTFPAGGIDRVFEKIEKDFFGGLAHGIAFSAVVCAEVVIVPGSEHRGGIAKFSKAIHSFEFAVFFLEDFHVPGVPVNVVAKKNEDIGGLFEDGIEHDVLFIAGIVAGAEGDGVDLLVPMEVALDIPACKRKKGD